MTPQENLRSLGLTLPPAPRPVGSYLPAVRTGNLIFVSGQLPLQEGRLGWVGKVPLDVDLPAATQAARTAVLNAVAILAEAAGGLDRIARIVRLGVFVNSAPGFADQPKVANAASDLLTAIFGESGKHARAAVGASELPLNAPVEIELVAEVLP